MRRGILFTTLSLVALAIGLNAWAGGRVLTTRGGDGREVHMLIKQRGDFQDSTSVQEPSSQDSHGQGGELADQSVSGRDPEGDGAREPDLPWVVWSRLNGVDHDLAYSRWTAEGWEPLRWLAPEYPKRGSDQDAKLAFARNSRPYVVWWRNEDGQGRVYLSTFLATRWMSAYGVSPLSLDARYPSLRLLEDDVIEVGYETELGKVTQLVTFKDPVTITDDIDPFDMVEIGEILYRPQDTN